MKFEKTVDISLRDIFDNLKEELNESQRIKLSMEIIPRDWYTYNVDELYIIKLMDKLTHELYRAAVYNEESDENLKIVKEIRTKISELKKNIENV
jgi:hypothetical protein